MSARDLGHPSPAALPDLLERLVRVRLLDRVGGPPDSGDAEQQPGATPRPAGLPVPRTGPG